MEGAVLDEEALPAESSAAVLVSSPEGIGEAVCVVGVEDDVALGLAVVEVLVLVGGEAEDGLEDGLHVGDADAEQVDLVVVLHLLDGDAVEAGLVGGVEAGERVPLVLRRGVDEPCAAPDHVAGAACLRRVRDPSPGLVGLPPEWSERGDGGVLRQEQPVPDAEAVGVDRNATWMLARAREVFESNVVVVDGLVEGNVVVEVAEVEVEVYSWCRRHGVTPLVPLLAAPTTTTRTGALVFFQPALRCCSRRGTRRTWQRCPARGGGARRPSRRRSGACPRGQAFGRR